jgi:hypothetical protein
LRLIAFPLALFFLPVLGGLSVGQYDFPVLLGTSLLVYSLRKENVALTVLGLVLLTFKPHVGALILLSVLGWLFYNGRSFGRRVIRPLILAAVILFAIGFIADRAWIVSYPKMLLGYQTEGNVSTCSECASLPVWLSRWLFDGSLTKAMWIAIALLFIFIALFYFTRSILRSPELLISTVLLITMLVSPYLYNYDFLLLLVPFAVLINQGNLMQKVVVILCYLVPTSALILYGRNGNLSLMIVSVVLLILCFTRRKNPLIDFTAQAA